MMRLIVLLAFLATSAMSFTTTVVRQSSMTRIGLMTQDETEALFKHANEVIDGKCSKEDVKELIDTLHLQQTELYNRIQKVKNTISSLETMNVSGGDRNVDEVRETIRAIYRVFQLGDKASGNDYPSLSKPTGWSGEVGDGPKTAYDALPPKKYKP